MNIWQSELQNFQSVSSVHKENSWQPCTETSEANEYIKVLEMKVRNLEAEKKSTEAKLKVEMKKKDSADEHYKLENKKLDKALTKEIENSKVLKRVIDNLNTEAAKNKSEIISANKALKAKDKEIHNLEKKSE